MNKEEVYAFLKEKGISFEATEHRAVFNMAELAEVRLPHPECDAKNLFVRDDKKQNYYLITVKGDKKVDLKAFRRANGLRPLSFASAEELADILKLSPGAVTPLGLLNDTARAVVFCLDREFTDEPRLIGVHPNDNTATVWLSTDDMLDIIRGHGNSVIITEVAVAK